MGKGLYLKILKVNLRYNFLFPLLSSICVFILTLILFNISALKGIYAAQPIEFLLCWIGVMFLTPIFLPEQDKDIRDVICSKKINYLNICLIRVLYSVISIFLLVLLFVGLMKKCESEVTLYHLFGGFSTAIFLGSVGFCVSGISQNTTLGYMAALMYYLTNYGLKSKLGVFYLFSMYSGSMQGKGYMFLGAIMLILVTLKIIKIHYFMK